MLLIQLVIFNDFTWDSGLLSSGISIARILDSTSWLYVTPKCLEVVVISVILCEGMKDTDLQSTKERKTAY